MSSKLRAVEADAEAGTDATPSEDEVRRLTEELPTVSIHTNSLDARIAGIEACSVLREVAKHWGAAIALELDRKEQRGDFEGLDPAEVWKRREQYFQEAWASKQQTRTQDEHDDELARLRRQPVDWVAWHDIGRLYYSSPIDALGMWRELRLEARNEFITGHYGARAFESTEHQHSAYDRAQYLAVRDGLIEEWQPRGASEFMLIDQMTHAYITQMYWTEKAMMRSQEQPRAETWQYAEWKRYRKAEERAHQWDVKGQWDIPYQHEAEAVEQAFRLVDLHAKSFQRAARQLANIRLVRAKTARTRRRERTKAIKAFKVA